MTILLRPLKAAALPSAMCFYGRRFRIGEPASKPQTRVLRPSRPPPFPAFPLVSFDPRTPRLMSELCLAKLTLLSRVSTPSAITGSGCRRSLSVGPYIG
jgi:hypothetical protein